MNHKQKLTNKLEFLKVAPAMIAIKLKDPLIEIQPVSSNDFFRVSIEGWISMKDYQEQLRVTEIVLDEISALKRGD